MFQKYLQKRVLKITLTFIWQIIDKTFPVLSNGQSNKKRGRQDIVLDN